MTRLAIYSLLVIGLISVTFTSKLPAVPPPSDTFIQQIIKLLGGNDREFRAAGLEQIRKSAKGEAATKLFAAELSKLDANGQVALLHALADRGDAAARPSVLQLASSSPDENVRAATIASLGKLGSAADVPVLIKSLSAKSTVEQAAARRSLVEISGKTISKTIAAEMKSAPAAVKVQLIDILATRRASSELPAFVAASVDNHPSVRMAAMNALGQLGRSEQIPSMLVGVRMAQPGGERDNAEKNVALVCARIGNEEARADTLINALKSVAADDRDRDQFLSLVGRVGGKKLIDYVRDVATGPDAARRRLGIDALSKWPEASVADVLLEIATKANNPAEQKQAFQGFVKIGATRDNRNDKQRLERMKQAMKYAHTPEEKNLVINRTRSAYDVESLRFVLPYVDQPKYGQIACETIVEIAHHREVRDPHKAEFDKALDKVIRTSKDPIVVERAQRYKRGETWDRSKKR